jgi:hypothetical protein
MTRIDDIEFDREDSSLKCINQATQNYRLWVAAGSSQIHERKTIKTILVFVVSYK